VIIAEVTGKATSQLNGALEIGGDKAALIVANPNGISANGASFINASRVTLATGTPQFDDKGNLTAINVAKGTITVTGKGVNATGTEMADLFARSVVLNAELRVKQLRIVTGHNKVKYDTNGNSIGYSALAGEGEAPKLALDVSALGSMYANAIRMEGSEDGVGVNVAGTVAAADSVSMTTAGAMKIAAGGVVMADGQVALTVGSDLTNDGTIATNGRFIAESTGGNEGKTSRFLSSGKSWIIAKNFRPSGDHPDFKFNGKSMEGNNGDKPDVLKNLPKRIEQQNQLEQDPPEKNPPEQDPPEKNPPVKNPPEQNPPVKNPPEQNPLVKNPPEQNPPVKNPPEHQPEQNYPHVSFNPGSILDWIFNSPSYGFAPWSFGYSPWQQPTYGYGGWNTPSFSQAPWMPQAFRPRPVFSPWGGNSYGFNYR